MLRATFGTVHIPGLLSLKETGSRRGCENLWMYHRYKALSGAGDTVCHFRAGFTAHPGCRPAAGARTSPLSLVRRGCGALLY